MAFFQRYHRRGLTFPLKFWIALSPTSVTCCSDHCHHQQFKPKPSYFHHLAGGRVAAVQEEASPPPRRRLWRRWRKPRRQRRRRWLWPSWGGRKRIQERETGWNVTWHRWTTQWFCMWWRRWWNGQGGQIWFLRETSTWTWRERADGDLTRRLQWRWGWWGLRTSPHTSSRGGERGIDTRERGKWWNRRGRWGPGRTIFWFLIVRYFRTWPSRTHDTTPATIWSWCFCVFPPRGITYITLGAGYAPLFVSLDIRQGHRRTIFLRSLGALYQSWHHNLWIPESTWRLVYDFVLVTLAI